MVSEKAKKLVSEANKALGKSRVKLEVHGKGDWLSLRGTFPPKPGSNKTIPYQQRISLDIRVIDKSSIETAKTIAKRVDIDLNEGLFDWRKFDGFEEEERAVTVAHWVDVFTQHWWSVNSNKDTWRTKYAYPLRSLLANYGHLPITNELLRDWILNCSPKDGDSRRRFCRCAKVLSELAGLPSVAFKPLQSKYSSKAVNPRSLPSDEEIVKQWEALSNPGWQFIYGMLATYGLRPHEVFKFDRMKNGNVIRTWDETKTGARIVPPMHEHWFELFGLEETRYPSRIKLREGMSNSQLGNIVSRFFWHTIKSSAYNLRHCYARRWLEHGLNADVGAKFMGHSPTVHVATYRSWIEERTYLEIARKTLER